jgi:soluble lytic murein transglycosylase-like protein
MIRLLRLASVFACACVLGAIATSAAGAVDREIGTGVIRVNGHGAEHWHWEYQKAMKRLGALEQRLSGVPRREAAYALRVASAAYGVPYRELRAVAACETGGTFSPLAYNSSSGAAGLLQFLASTWNRTAFARFSRFDPVANALAAADIVAEEGWLQWTCQP